MLCLEIFSNGENRTGIPPTLVVDPSKALAFVNSLTFPIEGLFGTATKSAIGPDLVDSVV